MNLLNKSSLEESRVIAKSIQLRDAVISGSLGELVYSPDDPQTSGVSYEGVEEDLAYFLDFWEDDPKSESSFSLRFTGALQRTRSQEEKPIHMDLVVSLSVGAIYKQIHKSYGRPIEERRLKYDELLDVDHALGISLGENG